MSKLIKIYDRCPAWCPFIEDDQLRSNVTNSDIRARINELREHFDENDESIELDTTKIESHAECTKISMISYGEYLKEDFEERCKLKLLSK
jgi:hypothetical protein